MELTLSRQSDSTQVTVEINGRISHQFDLRTLIPDEHSSERPPQPLDDPITYGRFVYTALFPDDSPAAAQLAADPYQILLVTDDDALQTVPWEYAHGPDDFLVCDYPFLRGLPPQQRIDSPALDGTPLHIVAVPSNPLDGRIAALNIDGEWQRLIEVLAELDQAVTLERVRPPTLEQMRRQVANQPQRIIHFMGHGGLDDEQAQLLFENDYGGLNLIDAKTFTRTLRRSAYLVTLNACVSATTGATAFSNLAAALTARKVPYVLGMRFSILDHDARILSRVLYSELAQGSTVAEAVFQARLRLAQEARPWVLGVPVLYTALRDTGAAFTPQPGKLAIKDPRQPQMELTPLPRTDGTFHGRMAELQAIGESFTGDARPRLLTIHGGGGQGKTALAREAGERFAYAFPGGVWAINLEVQPTRADFVAALARFMGLSPDDFPEPADLESALLRLLPQRRLLIILDNAETLLQAVDAEDEAAIDLSQFVRQQVTLPTVTLLVTSRRLLHWPGEEHLPLGGLQPAEGARLFRENAAARPDSFKQAQAVGLSEQVAGHPLSLRLLALAYNATTLTFADFLAEYERHLLAAEDTLQKASHRHRTLTASIDTSVQFLDDDLRSLLSKLWVFRGPFLPETAVAVFDPDAEENTEGEPDSPIPQQLAVLHRRGLLARETPTFRQGRFLLYRLLPTLRPYCRQMDTKQAVDALRGRHAQATAQLLREIYRRMTEGGLWIYLGQQGEEDFQQALGHITHERRAAYLLHWGWLRHRLGDRLHGLQLTETALELAQGRDQDVALAALNNMAGVYGATGQPAQALELYNQALPIMREVGDRAGEAATLNNMAAVYRATGQPAQALELYNQALPIMREVGDRAGEAATLNNMAAVYRATGQPAQALELYNQALPIMREVGDRAGEAATLNNMAAVYRATGQPAQALELYNQALPIMREVGDRAGEAATLNNMAAVYRDTGQPAQALELYNQALPIRREVGDRAGEATTLNNMALVYGATGQPAQALELYNQALPIMREVGDRAGEAATLNNMAAVHYEQGDHQQAADTMEQVAATFHAIGQVAYEAAVLQNLAVIYQRALANREKAIVYAAGQSHTNLTVP